VVSDYHLAGKLRGDEILAWIYERHPEMQGKFVFWTGSPDECRQNADYPVPIIEKGGSMTPLFEAIQAIVGN